MWGRGLNIAPNVVQVLVSEKLAWTFSQVFLDLSLQDIQMKMSFMATHDKSPLCSHAHFMLVLFSFCHALQMCYSHPLNLNIFYIFLDAGVPQQSKNYIN